MRLIVENRFSLFGLVSLALAALFGIAFVTQSVTVDLGVSEPGTVRPERAVRVCPAPHETSDDDARSSVAAFAPRVSRDDDGELWALPVPPVPEEDDENGADEINGGTGAGESGGTGADENGGTGADESGGTGAGESGGTGADETGAAGDERDLVGEELTDPGLVWRTDTTDTVVPTAIHARDALASGLESAQTTVSDDAVTEVHCVEPAIGTWFALPGGNDPDEVELDTLTAHLSNPEDFRATVSVDIYTVDGPSYSPESRGIALGPGESFELDLTELVQNTPATGVHVRTSTGRVAASLLAEHASGGTDWVNPAAPPAKEAVLPGVPGGDGVRRLLLAAPGDDPVEVRVHVLTATPPQDDEEDEDDGDGAGTPADPRVVHVPPAASAWLTLEGVLGGEPGTVVIEADGPVVAGVVAEIDDGAETAYTAAVEPLSLPLNTTAVLPDVPEGVDTEVIVGSPERDTSVMATPIGAGGDQGDAVKVEIPAGTTRVFGPGSDDAWEPPPGIDPEDGYAVRLDLVEEGSGPVYVARVLRSGDGMSVLPVRPAPVEVALSIVRDSMVGVAP